MTYAELIEAVKKATGQETGVSAAMAEALDLWADMFAGGGPWVGSPVKSSGIPAGICSELARLTTCELATAVDGNDEVAAVYNAVLNGLRPALEEGLALGGMLFKPYLGDGDTIVAQTIRADKFVPLSFDSSGHIRSAALIEQVTIADDLFTRLELYDIPNATIENLAYRKSVKSTTSDFGVQVYLDSVPQWERLTESGKLGGPPFGFFRVPQPNTIDDSPMGVSVFGRVVELIEEADRRYSNESWEYEAKQAAVHIAQSLLKRNADGNFEYPGGKDRLYRTLEYNVGAVDRPLIDTFSPDIRSEAIYQGMQAQLRRIEFAVGLAYGTISDPVEQARTATEIRASRQRSFVTVQDLQRKLEQTLRETVESIAGWMGMSAPDVSFSWGDSVMVDTEEQQRLALLEYQAGIIDRVEYFKEVRGISQEEAERIAGEISERMPTFEL